MRAVLFAKNRGKLELALHLLKKRTQGRVERMSDKIVDPFFSKIGEAEMGGEKRSEEPVENLAQRLARRHLEYRFAAVALRVRPSA